MWLIDICNALSELHDIYGETCCVERIQNNYVTMTNGEVWHIDSFGNVERAGE